MKPLATLSTILIAGVLSGPVFAATTIEGMKVPVPTPRPHVTELVQATEGSASGQPPSAAQPDTMTTGSVTPDVAGIENYKAVDVTRIAVMRVDEISDKDMREEYRQLADGKSAGLRKLQADVRANPALVAALKARQVEVENVISAQPAADGSVTFIVM